MRVSLLYVERSTFCPYQTIRCCESQHLLTLACILWTPPSTCSWSTCGRARSSWNEICTEKTEMLCLLDTQVSLRCKCAPCASTLPQVEISNNLEWYSRETEGRTRILIHGFVNQTQLCVSLIILWSQTGSLQTTLIFLFSNRSLFRSSRTVVNLE